MEQVLCKYCKNPLGEMCCTYCRTASVFYKNNNPKDAPGLLKYIAGDLSILAESKAGFCLICNELMSPDEIYRHADVRHSETEMGPFFYFDIDGVESAIPAGIDVGHFIICPDCHNVVLKFMLIIHECQIVSSNAKGQDMPGMPDEAAGQDLSMKTLPPSDQRAVDLGPKNGPKRPGHAVNVTEEKKKQEDTFTFRNPLAFEHGFDSLFNQQLTLRTDEEVAKVHKRPLKKREEKDTKQ
ncbi:Hypothetical predicted protein [Cloeon dipterum]|uniref:Uncharacterized protein n=2 Tax=Cloeon dipterum TaxID=197152 RepID=A0A8S1CE40_9INSE|nr:Hypothetical predicted protein [Cloeon dipterum]